MEEIARTTDQWTRPIVLIAKRWEHILDRHPDMAPHLATIMAAVSEPDFVMRDVKHARRENFYRAIGDGGKRPPRHVKVCIEYGPTGGTIITAYMTQRTKPGSDDYGPDEPDCRLHALTANSMA